MPVTRRQRETQHRATPIVAATMRWSIALSLPAAAVLLGVSSTMNATTR